jgi:hypothetical protein
MVEWPRPFFLPLFTGVRGETVWKIGMGPESGLRKRPRGVEGVPIGHFLGAKKHGRDAFGYFQTVSEGVFSEVGVPDKIGLIYATESLCITTTCSPHSRGLMGSRSHPRSHMVAFYARSCKRTSENTPSTHSGE